MKGRLSILLIGALFVLDAILNGRIGRAEAPGVEEMLRQEVAKRYYGAKIELTSPIHWLRNAQPRAIEKITSMTEGLRGDLRFTAMDENHKYHEGLTQFTASIPAWVATRRIQPGEKLGPEMFSAQEVNVSSGLAREYRGIILSPTNFKQGEMASTETRQTILEGHFVTSTAIQRTPAIRRGDAVTIRIESEGLNLLTGGVAQESAYLNGQIRVLTNKTKRELTGSLKSNAFVEVKL